MLEKSAYSTVLNELMGECFKLNHSVVEAARQLTEGADVTGVQWGVLAAFGQDAEPTTVAATARRMGLARQSVQRVADVLAEQDLINYLPNPADKRAKLIELSAPGKSLHAKLQRRQHAWADDVTGNYNDADLNAAIQLLKNIRQRISG
jgi:DNA-binding MarR family transcriptional regulator